MFLTLHSQRRDRGFSFIELLAYMAIAALLILAAIPQFNQYRAKAVISNMRDTAHNAALAAEAANIDAVSAHSSSVGGVRLASARVKLVAASSRFDTIKTAVLAVKKNAGETVAITDEGSSEYLIAVTSTKAPANTEVVYASSYATEDGITFPPGQSTVVNGALVGGPAGGAAGGQPSPPPTQATVCQNYMMADYVQVYVSKKSIPDTFPWGQEHPAYASSIVTNVKMFDKNGNQIDDGAGVYFWAYSQSDADGYTGFQYSGGNRYSDAQIEAFQDGGYITGTIAGKTNKLYYQCGQNGGTNYGTTDTRPAPGSVMPVMTVNPNPADLAISNGKVTGSVYDSTKVANLVWTTGNAKTFTASNVHVYANRSDYDAGKEISGAAQGSWTLDADSVGADMYVVKASGDLTGLTASQRSAWGNGLIIKFVDGNRYEVMSVTASAAPPPSTGGDEGEEY